MAARPYFILYGFCASVAQLGTQLRVGVRALAHDGGSGGRGGVESPRGQHGRGGLRHLFQRRP
eukprot:7156936-Alexandrium_andersonii.AAC.1